MLCQSKRLLRSEAGYLSHFGKNDGISKRIFNYLVASNQRIKLVIVRFPLMLLIERSVKSFMFFCQEPRTSS